MKKKKKQWTVMTGGYIIIMMQKLLHELVIKREIWRLSQVRRIWRWGMRSHSLVAFTCHSLFDGTFPMLAWFFSSLSFGRGDNKNATHFYGTSFSLATGQPVSSGG